MKKFIVFPFVFYFLLQINNLSYGQDDRWVNICSSDNNTWLLDKKTVQCNDGVYIVWINQVCIPYCPYTDMIRFEFDANSRKYGRTSLTRDYFDDNRDNDKFTFNEWDDIIPDSMGECA